MSANLLFPRIFSQASNFLLSTAKTVPTARHKLPAGFNQPTAFSLFIKENAKAGVKASEVVKNVAISWKQLDDSIKKSYLEKAQKIGAERKANYDRLSDEERFRLSEKRKEQKQTQMSRVRRRLLREKNEKSGRPKRPPNAYALFVSEFFKRPGNSAGSIAENAEILTRAATVWKSMSENDKQKYKDQAKSKSDLYAKELAEWKEEHESGGTAETKKLAQGLKKLKIDS